MTFSQSGVVNLQAAYTAMDMNHTYTLGAETILEASCAVSNLSSDPPNGWQNRVLIQYTRLEVTTIGAAFNEKQVSLPVGVKALYFMTGILGISPITDITEAVFYELVDPNPKASINCGNTPVNSFTSFDFADQQSGTAGGGPNLHGPIFDASAADVSYS